MAKVAERIQRAYQEALEGGETRVEYWFQHFGLSHDPLGDPFDQEPETWSSSSRWIVGIDELAERLAKDVAMSEKGYFGFVPIVGAPGVGRKTLCKVVAWALHREAEFREPADPPEVGKMSFLLGNTFRPADQRGPKTLEFVIFTNMQYLRLQQQIRTHLVDEIWVRPRSTQEIALTLKLRLESGLGPRADIHQILPEDAVRELCRYSMGLPGAALQLAHETFVAAFWAKAKEVSSTLVRRTAKQLGFDAAVRDYPGLSEPARNVASVLVRADGPIETSQVVEMYENMFGIARDRSVVSRHLNRLEILNLARRTERGRAASYEPTPALVMAVEREMYPR